MFKPSFILHKLLKTNIVMKLPFLLTVIFINGIIKGQSLEISVLDKKNKPMPYAYILINRKPVTVSDTMGKAYVPVSKLNLNDTISVSYLGSRTNWILYDASIKVNSKCTFYLEEPGYTLNEVVVNYQDIEKLLRRSLKNLPVLNYTCSMSGKFDYKLTFDNKNPLTSNNLEKPITGILEAKNDMGFKPIRFRYFDPPLNFNTDDDTLNLNSSINFNTHYALWFANLSINLCQQRKSWAKSYLTYLGDKENHLVFRVTYPKSLFQKFYYQIVLYVDKETKYLKHVEIDAYNDEPVNPPLNNYQYRFNLKYDCDLYTNKSPKKATIYLPVNINYKFQTIDYNTIDLKLSDLKIKK